MKEDRMRPSRIATAALAVMALGLFASGATATTLVRSGLERLTRDNSSILRGQVTSIRSYWNADRSFILTDVTVSPSRWWKGAQSSGSVTFTVMGGTVGETTTLIIGGPEFEPGSEYVMFLGEQDLPGSMRRLSVRDLSQGVFRVSRAADGRFRAISQAGDHPLQPDADGLVLAPGGEDGLDLDELDARLQALSSDH
jgi:hypothetical protein